MDPTDTLNKRAKMHVFLTLAFLVFLAPLGCVLVGRGAWWGARSKDGGSATMIDKRHSTLDRNTCVIVRKLAYIESALFRSEESPSSLRRTASSLSLADNDSRTIKADALKRPLTRS